MKIDEVDKMQGNHKFEANTSLAGTEPCLTIDEICAYLSEQLLTAEGERMSHHLSACPSCSDVFESLQRNLAILDSDDPTQKGTAGRHSGTDLPSRSHAHELEAVRKDKRLNLLKMAAAVFAISVPGFLIVRAIQSSGTDPEHREHREASDPTGRVYTQDMVLNCTDASGNALEVAELSSGGRSPRDPQLLSGERYLAKIFPDRPVKSMTIIQALQEEATETGGFALCVLSVDTKENLQEDIWHHEFVAPVVGWSQPCWLLALGSDVPIAKDVVESNLEKVASGDAEARIATQLRDRLQCQVAVKKFLVKPRGSTSHKVKPGVPLDRARLQIEILNLEKLLKDGGAESDVAIQVHRRAQELLRMIEGAFTSETDLWPNPSAWEHLELQRIIRLAEVISNGSREDRDRLDLANDLKGQIDGKVIPFVRGNHLPESEWNMVFQKLEKIFELRSRVLGSEDPLALKAKFDKAKFHLLRGERRSALEVWQSNKDLLEEKLGRTHPRYADFLRSYSLFFRDIGHHEAAYFFKREALNMLIASGVGDTGIAFYLERISQDCFDLAVMSADMDRFADAKSFAEQAEVWISRYTNEKTLTTDSLALMHAKRGKLFCRRALNEKSEDEFQSLLGEAEKAFQRSRDLYESYGQNDYALQLRFSLAEIQFLKDDYATANTQLKEAKILAERSPEPKLRYLADCDAAMGRVAAAVDEWSTAEKKLRQAMKQYEELRTREASLETRALFDRVLRQTASDLAFVFTKQKNGSLNAILAQEEGRNRALLDLLAKARPSEKLVPAPASWSAEAGGRKARDERQSEPDSATALGEDDEEDGGHPTQEIEISADKAGKRWMGPDSRLGRGNPVHERRELTALLDKDECLLYYSWSSDVLMVHLLHGSEDQPVPAQTYFLAQGRSKMQEKSNLLARTLSSLSMRPQPQAEAPSNNTRDKIKTEKLIDDLHRLYKLLLPHELRESLKPYRSITIVPDGKLGKLPFQALVVEPGSIPQTSRFVIDEFPQDFAYASSISLLREIRSYRRNFESRSISIERPALLVGDLVYGQDPQARLNQRINDLLLRDRHELPEEKDESDENLPSITDAYNHLNQIRNAILQSGGASRELRGREASLKSFMAHARVASMIYVLTHGRTGNLLDPEATGLLLSGPSEDPNASSHILSLGALLDLEPRAFSHCQLAVLLACESGLGSGGVFDPFNLAIGFHRAGVPSVLATLWRVNASVSLEFGRTLYTQELNLKTLDGKAATARSAQQALKKTQADPYYWAAFALFGDH